MRWRLLVALLVLSPNLALGCANDSDCKAGSSCLKAPNSTAGTCLEGLLPQEQAEPDDAPPDPNGTNGKGCSFDSDCGSGSRCVKNSTFEGVCMLGH
jgi:hypothetical protein